MIASEVWSDFANENKRGNWYCNTLADHRSPQNSTVEPSPNSHVATPLYKVFNLKTSLHQKEPTSLAACGTLSL